MLPSQRNKVDISKLTEEEQKLFRLYGKLPTHKNMISKMQKDRKFFDSGDYALSKAGKAPQASVGTAIPNPENIPHATPSPSINTANMSPGLLPGGASGNSITSPIRESPIAHPLEESTQPVASGGAERTAPILDAPVANPEPLPEALDNKEAMAQD